MEARALVHAKAKEKRDKADSLGTRQEAEKNIAGTASRVPVCITGAFGEKRFLVRLQDERCPCDIVNQQLRVPTLKGLLENTPTYVASRWSRLLRKT